MLIGAAAAIAECNGMDKASHVKDKLVAIPGPAYPDRSPDGARYKKRLARRLAGAGEEEPTPEEGGYFERVFEPVT